MQQRVLAIMLFKLCTKLTSINRCALYTSNSIFFTGLLIFAFFKKYYLLCIGKPTLDQRVQVFIEALDLGISTTPPTSQPATTDTPVTQPFTTKRPTTRPPTRPPTTRPGTRPPTTKPTTCITCYHNISYRAVTKRPTVTFRPSTRPQSVIVSQPLGGSLLGKRSINYCPSTGVVHKICSSGSMLFP